VEINEGLTREYKWWLVMTIIGAGMSFWLLMVVGKVWEDQVKLRNRIDQLEMRARIADELKIEKGMFEERIVELENFLVRGEEGVTEVAQALEQAADRSGVGLSLAFEDFPEKVDMKGKYQLGLEMNMEAAGSYQAVINWLQQVEKLPYFVQLKEVKIGLSRLGSGVKAEFSGIVYLINE